MLCMISANGPRTRTLPSIHVLLDFTEHLPEVLYLQLDNAGKQKNQYLVFVLFLLRKEVRI